MVKNKNSYLSLIIVIGIVMIISAVMFFGSRNNLKVELPSRFVYLTVVDSDYPIDTLMCDKVSNPVYVVDTKTNKIMCYEESDYGDDNSLVLYTIFDADDNEVMYSGTYPEQ